jgi:hypothetical protein
MPTPTDERSAAARMCRDDLPGHLEVLISDALAALQQEAKTLVDHYWAQTVQDNAAHVHDRSDLGVRARPYGDRQTSIQWFCQQVIPATHPQTGRRRVFSHYLRKGRGYRYPPQVLAAAAPAWQVEMVLDYEAWFAVLRRRHRALVALRRTVRQLAFVWATAAETKDVL